MVTTAAVKAFDSKTGLRVSEQTVSARLQRAEESMLNVITSPFTGQPAVQARNQGSIVGQAAAALGNNAYIAAAVPALAAVATPALIGGSSIAGAAAGGISIGAGALAAGTVGAIVGSSLGGGKATTAPQTGQQTQPIAPTTIQNTTTNTYTDQSIRQRYTIQNSPGASLYGSATPTASTSVMPNQTAPIDATQGLGQDQTATSSASSILPLLIGGAALLLVLNQSR